MLFQSKLPSMNIEGQRVLLRADLNVPIQQKKIINDYRLRSILPTLHLIQEKKVKLY